MIYVIADAFRRAKLTGNVEADREAIRQALLATDMVTAFGKTKFGNWAGPLGDPYTNQNIYSRDHSVLAQWREAASCSTSIRRVNAEVAFCSSRSQHQVLVLLRAPRCSRWSVSARSFRTLAWKPCSRLSSAACLTAARCTP